ADICFGPSTGPVLCMDAGSTAPAVSTALRMQPCVAGATSQSFAYTQDLTVMLVPSASTPGGPMCLHAVEPHTLGEEVDYQQCGRCLDVPGSSSKVNTSFLIVWPCKQAPDPTTIAANEKWTPVASPLSPGSGKVLLTMTDSKKGRYCLRTPDPGAVYVVLEDCNPGKPIGPEVEWT